MSFSYVRRQESQEDRRRKHKNTKTTDTTKTHARRASPADQGSVTLVPGPWATPWPKGREHTGLYRPEGFWVIDLHGLSTRMRASFRPPTTESSLVAHAPVLTLRQIYGRFRGDLRAVRGWVALSLVFVVLTPAVEAAEIWLFKLVVDQVLVPKDLSALPALALAYIGVNLVQGSLSFVDDVVAAATSTRFVHRLRTRTFDHLLRLGPEYLERHRLGDLVTRISGDVSAIETLLLDGLTRLISYAVQILIFGGLLFYVNWRLALAALIGAPLFVLVSRKFSRLIKVASRERRRRSGSVSAAAESSLRSARLITVYGAQDDEAAAYARESAVSRPCRDGGYPAAEPLLPLDQHARARRDPRGALGRGQRAHRGPPDPRRPAGLRRLPRRALQPHPRHGQAEQQSLLRGSRSRAAR